MRPQMFHVFKGVMFYSELKNKTATCKSLLVISQICLSWFSSPLPKFGTLHAPTKAFGPGTSPAKHLGKAFLQHSQANLCSLWGAKLLVLPVGMVLRLASLFSEVHPFLVGCWEFPESITMTAFSMEPDSGESKSAPGESLDEEVATFCFQGT